MSLKCISCDLWPILFNFVGQFSSSKICLRIKFRPRFRSFGDSSCNVTILTRSWFRTALFRDRKRENERGENRFYGAKRWADPSSFAKRVQYIALCTRSTYLLGARITVNDGHCTSCRIGRTNRENWCERCRITEILRSSLAYIFSEQRQRTATISRKSGDERNKSRAKRKIIYGKK